LERLHAFDPPYWRAGRSILRRCFCHFLRDVLRLVISRPRRTAAHCRSRTRPKSRPFDRRAGVVIVFALISLACERERRDFHPGADPNANVRSSVSAALTPASQPGSSSGVYDENAWAIGEGQRLYRWFNCANCHSAGGGGAIGPPLRDDVWIYGSAPDEIYTSIMQGRPDGMPAFRERIDPADVWKLVAYVRSMSRMTPPDTWSPRSEHMAETNPRRKR
jgi:cytochrome c oxidase cbb3-type subunit III